MVYNLFTGLATYLRRGEILHSLTSMDILVVTFLCLLNFIHISNSCDDGKKEVRTLDILDSTSSHVLQYVFCGRTVENPGHLPKSRGIQKNAHLFCSHSNAADRYGEPCWLHKKKAI